VAQPADGNAGGAAAGLSPPTALIGYSEALARALRGVQPLTPERVDLRLSRGRTLAEHILADRDQPPFNRATMDGVAVRWAEALAAFERGEELPVIAHLHAGQTLAQRVPAGACVAIATGAPLPRGLDTVIELERLEWRTGADGGSLSEVGSVVRFSSLPRQGASIHPRAADARRGRVLLARGARLTPQRMALAAAVGRARPLVSRLPRVALFTSGDEIVPESATPLGHQIRNSNGPLLASLIGVMGGRVRLERHLRDDAAEALEAVLDAARGAEVVVTVGGISAGTRDPFASALRRPHATLLVRGAAIQPGGPITVARLHDRGTTEEGAVALRRPRPRAPATRSLLIGLPGNPVSALVCAHLFLWPLMRRLTGIRDGVSGLWSMVELGDPVRPNPRRTAFRPGRLDRTTPGRVTVVPWAGSGDLASTAESDGVVELPAGDGEIPRGTLARFLPWAWRAE
jgi:molybdopterin molybdotransferase